jgi:lipopolysaccharide export system protein LptA
LAERLRPAMLVVCVAVWLGAPGIQARAQTVNLASDEGGPVEVFADEGIEWRQKDGVFIARGNAKAVRDGLTVFADELRAYYRKQKAGGTEIWRLDANGNVKVVSRGDTAYGDKGVYDLDNAVVVLTGKDLRLITPEERITASDSLEYWIGRDLAVARGDALVVHGERRLRADILTAEMEGRANAGSDVRRVNGFGNVTAVTDNEVIIADKGSYDVAADMVTLSGAVKITRDDNQLNGCGAEVNLKSGVSKLFSCAGNGAAGENGGQRIRGMFVPKNE